MEFITLDRYEEMGGGYDDSGNNGDACCREDFVEAVVLDDDDDADEIQRETGEGNTLWCDSTMAGNVWLVQADTLPPGGIEQLRSELREAAYRLRQPKEQWIFLTCTAHGKPVWRIADSDDSACADLPDRDVRNPPPFRAVGPYLVGPGGYESVEYGFECVSDPADEGIDAYLDDPSTWFEDPEWISKYLAEPA